MVVAELPLELLADQIERGRHVLTLRHRARNVFRGIRRAASTRFSAVRAGVVLLDQFELERGDAGLDALELGELVLGRGADLLGDRDARAR